MSESATTKKEKEKDKPGLFDNLSGRKLLATATASAIAATVTSKLTGYVNSILIVGISSIIVGISSEVLTRFLRKTGKISAKVALNIPYDRMLPGDVGKRINEHLESYAEDTEQIPAVGSDTADDDTRRIEPITATDTMTLAEPDTQEIPLSSLKEDEKESGSKGKGAIKWIKDRFQSLSPFTKYLFLFVLLAFMMTGVSWGVTTLKEAPNVTNVTTNRITEQKVERLSNADRAQIEKDIEAANKSNTSGLESKLNAQQSTIDELSNRISALEASSSRSDSGGSAQDANRIAQLESQVESLRQQVQQEKQSAGQSGNGQQPQQTTPTPQAQQNSNGVSNQ